MIIVPVKKKTKKRNPVKIKKVGIMELNVLKKATNKLHLAKTKADLHYQLKTAKEFEKQRPDYID